MLTKGYVATSVDEICRAAGVTKGSFFHYFKNKEALGKVLLERFASKQAAFFAESLANIEDPLARVYAMIDCAIASSEDPESKGCLVGTFAQEISETHPELREVCQCTFERFAAGVAADLAEAKKRHAPGAPFDPAELGGYFLSIAQGSMLLVKSGVDRSQMAANLRHFKQYLGMLYGN